MRFREQCRQASNNKANPNKNICGNRVADALNVSDGVRYLHTIEDLKRAAMKRYSVRSVKSYTKGAKTVGQARKHLSDIPAFAYIVHVERHVLLLSSLGETIVDTDPRKRDKRKLLGIWGVYHK